MTAPAEGDGGGPLHLLKMAVGVTDLDDLRRVRAERSRQLDGSRVYTRNHPRRVTAVLAGGSLYWVIRGHIRVRQRVTGFTGGRDEKGRAYCLIGVDPELVPTLPRAWRPFQGWRYLTPADAPPDLASRCLLQRGAGDQAAQELPERLRAELRMLGLW